MKWVIILKLQFDFAITELTEYTGLAGFFVLFYKSLMIKSTKKISNWTTVTVSSEYIQWLIIHNHAHCLLCIVTYCCMRGTAHSWSVSHFASQKNIENTVQIEQKRWKDFSTKLKLVLSLSHDTLGPCVVSFTKDSRGLVTPLTQVTDQWHWHSGYKLLLSDWHSCCELLLSNFSKERVKLMTDPQD